MLWALTCMQGECMLQEPVLTALLYRTRLSDLFILDWSLAPGSDFLRKPLLVELLPNMVELGDD